MKLPRTVLPITDTAGAEYSTTLSERNVCIVYQSAGRGGRRKELAQQLISLRHLGRPSAAIGVLLGFSEYTLNYHKLLTMRAAADVDEIVRLRRVCQQRQFGFAIPLSFNNVYHATFHAVPALEWWNERDLGVSGGGPGEPPTFIPILHHRMLRGKVEPTHWYAWEFATRALTDQKGAKLLADVGSILATPGCACFARLEGSARAFNFNAKASRERLNAFRTSLLLRVHRPLHSPALQPLPQRRRKLLYVHREARTRTITNDAAVHAGLSEACRGSLLRAVLDRMPLVEQMKMVSSATSIVAAFGQALTWMLLLPPPAHGADEDEAETTARATVLELAPQEAFWKQDYQIRALATHLPPTRHIRPSHTVYTRARWKIVYM
jgi:hypothetical protein